MGRRGLVLIASLPYFQIYEFMTLYWLWRIVMLLKKEVKIALMCRYRDYFELI